MHSANAKSNILLSWTHYKTLLQVEDEKARLWYEKETAKQIYDCLTMGGALVIEGLDKKDCWALKELFGKGQAYNDEKAISEKDYEDIVNAGFSKVEKDNNKKSLYVVCDDNKIIVVAAAGKDDELDHLKCWNKEIKMPCDLAKIGVIREYQGKGIAKILVKYIEQDILKRGFDGEAAEKLFFE